MVIKDSSLEYSEQNLELFFDENDTDNYLKIKLGKGLSYRILIEASDYGVYPIGITEHEYLDSLEGKKLSL